MPTPKRKAYRTSQRRGSFFGSFQQEPGWRRASAAKGSANAEVNAIVERTLGGKKKRASAARAQKASDAARSRLRPQRGKRSWNAENARSLDVLLPILRRELNRRCMGSDTLFGLMYIDGHSGVIRNDAMFVRAPQFGAALRKCALDMSPSETDQIFQRVDLSGRGWISHGDLQAFLVDLGVGYYAEVLGEREQRIETKTTASPHSSVVWAEESVALRATHRRWECIASTPEHTREQGLRGTAAIGHETAWSIIHMVQQCGLASLSDIFVTNAATDLDFSASASAKASSSRITFDEFSKQLRRAGIETSLYERDALWHVATSEQLVKRRERLLDEVARRVGVVAGASSRKELHRDSRDSRLATTRTMDWREIKRITLHDTHMMRKRIRAAAYRGGGCNLTRLFEMIDVNQDGSIDYNEFVELVRRRGVARGTGHVVSDIELRFVFNSIDTNCDGDISLFEFMEWMSRDGASGAESSSVLQARATRTAFEGRKSPEQQRRDKQKVMLGISPKVSHSFSPLILLKSKDEKFKEEMQVAKEEMQYGKSTRSGSSSPSSRRRRGKAWLPSSPGLLECQGRSQDLAHIVARRAKISDSSSKRSTSTSNGGSPSMSPNSQRESVVLDHDISGWAGRSATPPPPSPPALQPVVEQEEDAQNSTVRPPSPPADDRRATIVDYASLGLAYIDGAPPRARAPRARAPSPVERRHSVELDAAEAQTHQLDRVKNLNSSVENSTLLTMEELMFGDQDFELAQWTTSSRFATLGIAGAPVQCYDPSPSSPSAALTSVDLFVSDRLESGLAGVLANLDLDVE